MLIIILLAPVVIGVTAAYLALSWQRSGGRATHVLAWLISWLCPVAWVSVVVLTYRVGGLPNGDVVRSGTAQILRCGPNVLSVGYLDRLHRSRPLAGQRPHPTWATDTNVLTTHRLSGESQIKEICSSNREGDPTECHVLASDFPTTTPMDGPESACSPSECSWSGHRSPGSAASRLIRRWRAPSQRDGARMLGATA